MPGQVGGGIIDSVGKEMQVHTDTQVGRKMDDRWGVEKWIDRLSRGETGLWSGRGKDERTGGCV